MKRLFSFLFLTFSIVSNLFAESGPGHKIRVKLDNYPEKELVIGFHYGEKQYVKDTVALGSDGYFTFEADTLFPAGMYLLVTKPDNNFIQILMPAKDQDFTIQADVKESVKTMKVKGSEDNEVFYDYLRFLAGLRPEADTLRAQLGRAKGQPADSIRLADQLNGMDKRVKKYQADICEKYPNTLVTKIVRSAIEPEPPAFTGTEKEKQNKRYYWYRAHYFDHIDIADAAMLRSPVLHGKIEQYIGKIIPQHPDSINIALDDLLGRVKGTPETFKYYLVHYLNFYAKSKLVGFDACYVHLAKKYYCKDTPSWMKKEDVEKICDNAMRLDPILIGRIAPNITVMDRNNQPHSLWDVDADYTVLFFWASDCGHCKKAAPYMIEFAKQYKNKGVKVFAVCTDYGEKAAGECWKGVDEKGFTDDLFMTMHDPYQRSRFKSLYDVQTTPQVFILDRKHEILMKRISAEELAKVMDQVIRYQEEKKNQGK